METLEFARTGVRRLLIEGDEGKALTNEAKKQARRKKIMALTFGAIAKESRPRGRHYR